MDSTEENKAFLVEQTTTLIYDSAVIARQRRMEIRRFKKLSSSSASPRSLNSVQQGAFKRSRPLRTTSICSVCYHDCNGDEDECAGFPLSNEGSLPFTTRFLTEIELPCAYGVTEGHTFRGGGLGRSKSLPEGVCASQCILHITKARHDQVAMNVEGKSMTVVSDKHVSAMKEALPELHVLTSEVISSVDPYNAIGGMPTTSVKDPLCASTQKVGESESTSSKIVAESTLVDSESSKKVIVSVEKQLEMDVHMPEPGDSFDTTSGPNEVVTPIVSTSSCALADPHILQRCPLSGKLLVCGRRREMEDTAVIVPSFMRIPCSEPPRKYSDLHFFAVYDGHGGAQASNFCSGRLHHALAEELASSKVSKGIDDDSEWKKVMTSCFLKVDQEVGGVCPSGACDEAADNPATCCVDAIAPENVGTTAVVAVFSPSKIVLANCGDSRAVLSRGGVAIPLTKDHKPERDDETSRIEAAGGRVIYWDGYRVSGLLALSRAIGDRYLKQYVISEPEVLCLPRTDDDECLILATDGLWDVISNETACDVARRCLASARKRPERQRSRAGEDTASAAVAALLVKLAYGRGSMDNISVVVIDLKSKFL